MKGSTGLIMFSIFSTNSFYCIVITISVKNSEELFLPYFVSMEIATILDFMALIKVHAT